MKEEPLSSNSKIENFEIEKKNEEIKTASRVRLYGVIGIVAILIVLVIIIVALPSKKKENDDPVTPQTEEEKYREEIKNKIKAAYTEKPVSENSTFLLVKGSYIQMDTSFLDAINKIRKDACDEGITDPRTLQPLKSEDYVALKWSSDLEKISRIRDTETTIFFSQDKRSNGGDPLEIKINNIGATEEIVGLSGQTGNPQEIIDNFNKVKDDYKKDPSSVKAKEYKTIINPANNFIGMTSFKSDFTMTNYTIAFELSNLTTLTESKFLDSEEDIYQTVDILKTQIGEYKIDGTESMIENATQYLVPRVKINTIYEYIKIYAWPYNFQNYEFSTNNTDIISLNVIGKVEAKKIGTAVVTLTDEEKKLVSSLTINVECVHEFEYYYTKDSENKTVGHKKCNKCGYTIDFMPPNDVIVIWNNNVTTKEEYKNEVPKSNPIGSAINGYFLLDGDNCYKDMLVKVSEEGYLDNTIIDSDNRFKFTVLKAGTVNVTFYPKYNVNYTKEFEITLGN